MRHAIFLNHKPATTKITAQINSRTKKIPIEEVKMGKGET
jgi:hypothetical protein